MTCGRWLEIWHCLHPFKPQAPQIIPCSGSEWNSTCTTRFFLLATLEKFKLLKNQKKKKNRKRVQKYSLFFMLWILWLVGKFNDWTAWRVLMENQDTGVEWKLEDCSGARVMYFDTRAVVHVCGVLNSILAHPNSLI